jgi:transcriptional regulator with XRE-family HTH domain
MTEPAPAPLARFGALILRGRQARRLSVRDLAAASGVAVNVVSRAERGLADIRLSNALRIAAALGISLDGLADPVPCQRCGGVPPAGFACLDCGRGEPR